MEVSECGFNACALTDKNLIAAKQPFRSLSHEIPYLNDTGNYLPS